MRLVLPCCSVTTALLVVTRRAGAADMPPSPPISKHQLLCPYTEQAGILVGARQTSFLHLVEVVDAAERAAFFASPQRAGFGCIAAGSNINQDPAYSIPESLTFIYPIVPPVKTLTIDSRNKTPECSCHSTSPGFVDQRGRQYHRQGAVQQEQRQDHKPERLARQWFYKPDKNDAPPTQFEEEPSRAATLGGDDWCSRTHFSTFVWERND